MCETRSSLKVLVEIATEGPRTVCLTPVEPEASGKLVVPLSFPGGFIVTGENMATTLTDNQQVSAGPVTALSAAGNPAELDGAPVWESSDPSVIAVEAAADGLTALIKAAGAVGNAQVTVKADADLDEGEVRELTGVLDFTVIAGEAATLSIPVGTPEEQPPATP